MQQQVALKQQIEEQKEFYEKQLNLLQDEVQFKNIEKDGLGSKLKKLYQRTSERIPDEQSKQELSNLFNEVMQEGEAVGE